MKRRRWWLVLAVGALVACGNNGYFVPFCGDGVCLGPEDCGGCEVDCGQCPVGCGDGTCHVAENCDSCAPDCGQCLCAPGDGTCGPQEACIDESCQDAFGRVWSIIIAYGNMPAQNGAGDAWDAHGGAPDPFVEISLNGVLVGTTSEKADTFTPTWSELVSEAIPAGSWIKLVVWDSDLAGDDLMFWCDLDPLTAAHLDNRAWTCGDAGFDLLIRFVAPQPVKGTTEKQQTLDPR